MHWDILLTALMMALAVLCFGHRFADKLIEALNNFRGGPGSPMHPSPANDGWLLRRKRRKS